MRRAWAAAAAVAATVALVAGCGPDSAPRIVDGYATAVPTTSEADPQGEFYGQQLVWSTCMNTLECAKVKVPLDWSNPRGETIEVALAKRTASGTKQGTLLINPGGPGGSGIGMMSSLSYLLSKKVLDAYDVVGFDPRGVGKSTAIKCVSDAQMDEWRADSYPVTDAGIAQETNAAIGFGQACKDNSGDLLGFVDTNSAAKDMDVIRAAVGDDTINYLGYSYGTFLGASYAELFPQNVGRMVLDGAMDPSIDSDQLSIDQAAGFEAALGDYLADCVAGKTCKFTSVADGKKQIRKFIESLLDDPLPTVDPDRKLTQSLGVSGIITPLYDDGYWQFLSQALQAALEDHDGSLLLSLADLSADRNKDGTYAVNSTEANYAINCLDHPENDDPAQMEATAAKLKEASPTFWDSFAYGEVMCANWPVAPTRAPGEIHANGAAPIVVIGTTGDPATPYQWSQSLADQMSSATLVTYEGEGHTAYGRSNKCISSAVNAYLLDGTVPEQGLTC